MKTFADLFCGGGLGARGAVQAGMSPVLAVDLWDVACRTYKANFPGAEVLNKRVEDIDPLVYCESETLDLLMASPECTNHSVAKGAATRSESSRETALHTVDWIAALRPKWFIIENVKEMKSWKRYVELLDLLRGLGYQTREQVINAAEFGAPQSRVRLFLIGGHNVAPPLITPPDHVRLRTVRDILDPDGTWPTTPLFVQRRAAATRARARDAISSLGGSEAEFLIVYYGSGGEKSWQRLDVPLRTITTIDRFALVKKIKNRWQMRMLQPSELARAMSLPPEHLFPTGSRREKVKVCGNGVCSVVVERIVHQLRAAMPPQTHSEIRTLLRGSPVNTVTQIA
jgi:DNA (cytosine-5)-methyltransferase 1